MRMRVDESREDPASGQIVQHFHARGPLHPVAESGDLAPLNQEIAL